MEVTTRRVQGTLGVGCKSTQTIKDIVLSVEQFAARVPIERHWMGTAAGDKEPSYFEERAKEEVKHVLFDGITQLFEITHDPIRNEFVEARVYMPYVRNNVVKRLERQVRTLEERNSSLAGEIQYLKLSWWTKLKMKWFPND